ncbi:MAG: phosphoribosylaminoimidazolesuccinocarboxamide synthase [Candidatus Hodarchaeota archaeon]
MFIKKGSISAILKMKLIHGKNKDGFSTNGTIKFVFSDRLSVFDQVVGSVEGRGRILAECSRIVFNFLSQKDVATAMISGQEDYIIMEECKPLYFEFITRNLLTGSALKRAQKGSLKLPDGMDCKEFASFPHPFIEVSTKKEVKDRYDLSDEDILRILIISLPECDPEESMVIYEKALAISERISQLLAILFDKADLVFVDGKIELGINKENRLCLIDSFGPDEFRAFDKAWLNSNRKTKPYFYDKQFIRHKLENAKKTDYERILHETKESLLSRYNNVTERLKKASDALCQL